MDNPSYLRQKWVQTRAGIEKRHMKKTGSTDSGTFNTKARLFGRLIKPTPFYTTGIYNAAHPRLVRVDLSFNNLPMAFDGFTILHLTDLHLDFMPELSKRISELVRGLAPDICVMTGDYMTGSRRDGYKTILEPMARIVSAVDARHGVYATLGNHDTWKVVTPFEAMGIQVLVNETCRIEKDGQEISITGTDDPHEHYTPDMVRALETAHGEFKLALVHTPELYREAQKNGYSLYLAGHTHGGQICLPGGLPLVVHLNKGHRFYRGLWQYGDMTGYTGQGAGAVGIPIRLNTFSEVTLLTLRAVGKQEPQTNEQKRAIRAKEI